MSYANIKKYSLTRWSWINPVELVIISIFQVIDAQIKREGAQIKTKEWIKINIITLNQGITYFWRILGIFSA